MFGYEKIYFEAHINKEYICLKNNCAQLYILYLREPTSEIQRMTLIFTDFPTGICGVGNM